MRILVSNDDGIHALGLQVLAQAMEKFGEVWVVAPDRERSGAGHSLTLHRPLRIFQRGPRLFTVDGTPTDCVSLGVLEVMKRTKPDVVVSGMNHGPNLGDDVTYSGTVAAALEGSILGFPSVAFSLVTSNGEEANFFGTEAVIHRVFNTVQTHGVPSGAILNVNIPNRKQDDQASWTYEVTRLGSRRYAGATVEKIDPRGKKYYWIGADELDFEDIAGSDSNAIRSGRVSITPIRVDMTHEPLFEEMRGWNLRD